MREVPEVMLQSTAKISSSLITNEWVLLLQKSNRVTQRLPFEIRMLFRNPDNKLVYLAVPPFISSIQGEFSNKNESHKPATTPQAAAIL